MSAKLLQLVNSAYFGSAQRVESIRQAVRYLGVETLKGLALSSAVFSSFEGGAVEGFSPERFQRNSMAAARIMITPPLNTIGFDTINGQDITAIYQAMKNVGYTPQFVLGSVQYYLDAQVKAAQGKVDQIKAALERLHVVGMTATEVRDHWPQNHGTTVWKGANAA